MDKLAIQANKEVIVVSGSSGLTILTNLLKSILS